jgi:hypothetical protein
VHVPAQLILTFNLKDFPVSAFTPHGVVAEHPDTLLTHLYDGHPDILQQIVLDQAAALKNPPLTVRDVLNAFTQHVPVFATRLRASLPE